MIHSNKSQRKRMLLRALFLGIILLSLPESFDAFGIVRHGRHATATATTTTTRTTRLFVSNDDSVDSLDISSEALQSLEQFLDDSGGDEIRDSVAKARKLSEEQRTLLRSIVEAISDHSLPYVLHDLLSLPEIPDDTLPTETNIQEDAPPEEAMPWRDFCYYAIDTAKEKSEKDPELWNSFSVDIYGVETGQYWGRVLEPDAMKQKIRGLPFQDDEEGLLVRLAFNGAINDFSTFQESNVDRFFKNVRGNLNALTSFLQLRATPLAKGDGFVTPNQDFVSADVSREASNILTENIQADKARALVVAGESGSGKSVYSCLVAQKYGFVPVYCVVPRKDNETESIMTPETPEKPDLQHRRLNDFLANLIAIVYRSTKKDESVAKGLLSHLFSITKKLNVGRDKWASQVVDFLVRKALVNDGDSNTDSWYHCQWDREEKPEKVAVIIDEATDLDLAAGIVSIVRKKAVELQELLARKRVLIVVAGTGLDALEQTEQVGTDPACSALITVRKPNLDALLQRGEVPPVVVDAVNKGVFSRILQDNSRMLFRSVLPILKSDFHRVDGAEYGPGERDQRRLVRLIAIGSFRHIMDHAPRYYVSVNTVGRMANQTRGDLLQVAFAHHILQSVSKVDIRNVSASLQAPVTEEKDRVRSIYQSIGDDATRKEIFSKGLVTRDKTSNALKYLSCFGLTCALRSGFGDEFEELTALHYMRYMEIQNYTVKRIILRHAWPPKRAGGNTTLEEAIERLPSILDKQEAESLGIAFPLTPTQKYCFVYSQGTPTAQGGDILALCFTTSESGEVQESYVDIIQCKHYERSPGPQVVETWWSSFGIDGQGNTPTGTSSATYSNIGLMHFCSLADKALKRTGTFVKNRILACSFPTPGPKTEFPVPPGTRVWFREMMEPTISLVNLREAEKTQSVPQE